MTNPFSILPLDKLMHIFVGIVIGIVVTMLSNPVAGIIAALGAGAFKEWVIDGWMKWGNFDPMDFWATVAGGVIGSALGVLLPMIGKLV